MSCINTGHPQYKALKQLAVQDKRDTLDFYLDVSRYNDLYLKFPTSLSELDNGLEDIYYRDLLATEVFKIAQLNSPAVTNPKTNVFEFRVVERSDKINTRGQAYKAAENTVKEINSRFSVAGQPNIVRLSDESGIIKITLEPNQYTIDSYKTKLKTQELQDKLEYEESNNVEDTYDVSEEEASKRFNELLASDEIKQTCKIG